MYDEGAFEGIANNILAVVRNCFEDRPCQDGQLEFFVSHGRPPADCCCFAAVWLRNVRPTRSGSFPFQVENFVRPCEELELIMNWVVTLRRSCSSPPAWDLSPGGQVRIPSDQYSVMHTNGLALLRDANVLFCCMKDAWDRGILTGQDGGAFSDEQIAWDALEPYGPDGGCAGWDLSFLVGAPACDC